MHEAIITNGFEETQTLGIELARHLNGKHILALHGDLGSGKTTFIQGFAKGLGITQNIISPTFIIMRMYEIKENTTLPFKHFYHVDLYRIENEKDVEGLGLLEIMQDPENIVAIEWPEKIINVLPKDRCDLLFTYLDEDKRAIAIDK